MHGDTTTVLVSNATFDMTSSGAEHQRSTHLLFAPPTPLLPETSER